MSRSALVGDPVVRLGGGGGAGNNGVVMGKSDGNSTHSRLGTNDSAVAVGHHHDAHVNVTSTHHVSGDGASTTRGVSVSNSGGVGGRALERGVDRIRISTSSSTTNNNSIVRPGEMLGTPHPHAHPPQQHDVGGVVHGHGTTTAGGGGGGGGMNVSSDMSGLGVAVGSAGESNGAAFSFDNDIEFDVNTTAMNGPHLYSPC